MSARMQEIRRVHKQIASVLGPKRVVPLTWYGRLWQLLTRPL